MENAIGVEDTVQNKMGTGDLGIKDILDLNEAKTTNMFRNRFAKYKELAAEIGNEAAETASGKRMLVAGATGYLGRYVIDEACRRGYKVQALARSDSDPDTVRELQEWGATVVRGDVTKPETIHGIAEGVDVVISCLASRWSSRWSSIFSEEDYWSVDKEGNIALFREAQKTGVRHFVLVSTYEGSESRLLTEFSRAKEEAVDVIIEQAPKQNMIWTIIRPPAYFKDLLAHKWNRIRRASLLLIVGDGSTRINPIDGSDLAEYICDCLDRPARHNAELKVGGPDIVTRKELGVMAAEEMGRLEELKIRTIPPWVLSPLIALLSVLGSVYAPARRIAAAMKWMVFAFTHDAVGECYGQSRLRDKFREMEREDRRRCNRSSAIVR